MYNNDVVWAAVILAFGVGLAAGIIILSSIGVGGQP